MNEYFTRFGAADYNIFRNGNTSYVCCVLQTRT